MAPWTAGFLWFFWYGLRVGERDQSAFLLSLGAMFSEAWGWSYLPYKLYPIDFTKSSLLVAWGNSTSPPPGKRDRREKNSALTPEPII
jgi:hypothetical protein